MKPLHLIFILVSALQLIGCRKDDNPRVPDLEEVPLPQITLKEGEEKIPGDEPASFSAVVTVDVYFKQGLQPKSFDLVVIKNDDKSNPKVLQANITTFPTDVTITGQQLIDLFGSDISLGDAFMVGADVFTQEGENFAAFPDGGVTYAPGIANLPGINTELRFAAPCLYDPAAYTEGDYEVVVDEWADYSEGDIVFVTKIDDTHFSFKYAPDNAQPIVFAVNPADNSITADPQVYGDYTGVVVTAKSVPGAEVDPCDVSFIIKLNHSAPPPYGDLGDYIIRLRKL